MITYKDYLHSALPFQRYECLRHVQDKRMIVFRAADNRFNLIWKNCHLCLTAESKEQKLIYFKYLFQTHEYFVSIHYELNTSNKIVEFLKNKKFVLGVQWHPEMMITKCDQMQKLFNAFVQASSKGENE